MSACRAVGQARRGRCGWAVKALPKATRGEIGPSFLALRGSVMLMSRTAETLGPTVSLASNVTHEARTQTDREKLDAQIERDRTTLVVRLSLEERP